MKLKQQIYHNTSITYTASQPDILMQEQNEMFVFVTSAQSET